MSVKYVLICLSGFMATPAIAQEMTSYDLCVEDVYRSAILDKAVDCHFIKGEFFKGRVESCSRNIKTADLKKAKISASQTWKAEYKGKSDVCQRLHTFVGQAFE